MYLQKQKKTEYDNSIDKISRIILKNHYQHMYYSQKRTMLIIEEELKKKMAFKKVSETVKQKIIKGTWFFYKTHLVF